MGAPRIDLSRFPVVTVTFDGLATEQEFDTYLAEMERFVQERRGKSVTILDARTAGRAPASQRKKQADWLNRNREVLTQYSVGSAFVITSSLVRGVLTAILWLQTMPTAYTVVGTLAEAERWAGERLLEAGVKPPAPLTTIR